MRPSALPCFDELLELARNSPEDLEALRRKMTSEILNSTLDNDMRQRLEQLAFRIDAERRSGRPPLALCIHYSSLMHSQLAHLSQELSKLFNNPCPQQPGKPLLGELKQKAQQKNSKVICLDQYRKGQKPA
ncbi:Protein of unknown function [Marinospirillum celere]|uniref:DUF3135 domain-containing protein n=1 Tax=Marinospirillum celere TaxID=1122252 RepID=A0A1I1GK51_9GAMM|nr:DUF3135 domain-containing protein [Marinospirillum celere]SFC12149.1 Protein of unknown function [Marinospirillum celere]